MSYGILLLRVVLGLSVAAHGAQKLFGWFGGAGPRGTAAGFGSLGFRRPLLMALAAGAAEVGGGLLLAGGLLTPLASLAIVSVMLNAIVTVHAKNGFWNTNGGYELNLLIIAAAVALAMTGASRFSFDALLGWEDQLGGLWWGIGVTGLAVVASAATLIFGRRPHAAGELPATDELRRAA